MKRNIILRGVLPLLTVVLGLSSCLKDDNVQQDFSKLTPMVEFADADPNLDGAPNSVSAEFVSSDPAGIYNLELRYAHSNPSPGVTVTVAIDEATLTKYNTVKDQEWLLAPTNGYSIPNNKVTIPSGSQSVAFPINIDPIKFIDEDEPEKIFAIPLKITDASGTAISGNFGSIVVLISIKNKWDGNYTVTATSPMVDTFSPGLSGFYPLDSDLRTVGPNSVEMYCNTYLGGYQGHPIKSGTASSYYGNFGPIFTMDDAGNVVSIANHWETAPGNSLKRSARLDPTGINKFVISADGKTKVMDVSYVMTQGGTDRTFFHEKWTFVKAR